MSLAPGRVRTTPPAQLSPSGAGDNEQPETNLPQVVGWDYHWSWGDGQRLAGHLAGYPYTKIWGDRRDDFIIPITLTVTNAHCRSEGAQR